jgi:hypothetical protein
MTSSEYQFLIDEARRGLRGFAYGPGSSMVSRLVTALIQSRDETESLVDGISRVLAEEPEGD